MAYEFKLTRQIDFAETDMAGIMHFSNFFRFMEAAETRIFSFAWAVDLSKRFSHGRLAKSACRLRLQATFAL